MDKPFLSYEELVAKLRDEKTLTVPDEDRVIALLKKHSYFSLVSGYKSLFKQPNGDYRPNTTIEDIYALFEFDNRLRDIFFHAIRTVEMHIKSLLSHRFVEKYGDYQGAYLNPDSYRTDSPEVLRLIQILRERVQPPFQHTYLEHQWNRHGNVPLWAAIKVVTLGTTSKLYSLCTQDIQAAVSKEFPCVREEQLVGMLDLLTRVRNVCAHNERLYDFNAGKRRAIQDMPIHAQLGIGKKNGVYKKGKSDLFAAVICLKYLLSREEFCAMMDDIRRGLDDLCARSRQVQREKILNCMGFPPNWYDSTTDQDT